MLIYTTEKIRNALDNKYYACSISMDLEKAFYTVNVLATTMECLNLTIKLYTEH